MLNIREKNIGIDSRAFTWNLIGSIVNASTFFVLLAVVSWTIGLEGAGYFSIAVSIAQLFLSLGKYGVRAYQATDVNIEITPETYFAHRGIVIFVMMLLSVLFVILCGYNGIKGRIIICICGLKAVDAMEDVFHGELQRNGKLGTAGKALTTRNFLTIVFFSIIICLCKDLLISCISTLIFSIITCILINIKVISFRINIKMRLSGVMLKRIFIDCCPLCLGQFLSILIYNVPKYFIDRQLSSELQAIYSIMFMPTFIINLVSEFIFKPLLTPLAEEWKHKEVRKVRNMIVHLYLIILILTGITILGGYLFGVPILNLIYRVDIIKYRNVLLMLLLGGGLSATVYLSYNILAMLRKQQVIIFGYMIGAIFVIGLTCVLVERLEILGGAASYLFAEVVVMLYFCFSIYLEIKHKESSILKPNI